MRDAASRDRPSRTARARCPPTPSTVMRSSRLAARSFCRSPKWSTSRSTMAPGSLEVVADDELAVGADAADELVELQRQQPPVGAELDDVVRDLLRDAAHHLEALDDDRDVADRHEVLDLERGQCPGDLVEPGLVALEGGEGLVRLGQDRV